jgi:hypothetical protein
VTVDAVAVELPIACSGCTWRSLVFAAADVFGSCSSVVLLVLRLAFSCLVARCVTPWYVIFPAFLLV